LPPKQHEKGDHIVELKVVIPNDVSEEGEHLYKKLSQMEPELDQYKLSKEDNIKIRHEQNQKHAQEQKTQAQNQENNNNKNKKKKRQQDSDDEEYDEDEVREAFEQLFGGNRRKNKHY